MTKKKTPKKPVKKVARSPKGSKMSALTAQEFHLDSLLASVTRYNGLYQSLCEYINSNEFMDLPTEERALVNRERYLLGLLLANYQEQYKLAQALDTEPVYG